jgi:hypothetical protein
MEEVCPVKKSTPPIGVHKYSLVKPAPIVKKKGTKDYKF